MDEQWTDEKLRAEIARMHKRDVQADQRGEIAELSQELTEAKADYERACQTIAEMHAAAVGEVRGPGRGVVEDVEDLRVWALSAYNLAEYVYLRHDGNVPEWVKALYLDAPSSVKPQPAEATHAPTT